MNAEHRISSYRAQLKLSISAAAMATLEMIAEKSGKAPSTVAREILEDLLDDGDFLEAFLGADASGGDGR